MSPPAEPAPRLALSTSDPIDIVRRAPRGSPFVVAQLGQSLDGRIATATGESRWINRDSALDHVHRLRAAVDAVLVGVGTAVADDPQLNVRRVEGPSPARVVIDPWGRLPEGMKCLRDDGIRRLVIRACDAPVPAGCEIIRIEPRDRTVSPGEIVRALTDRGLSRILVEGGAWTVSQFIDADAVDRLHVLVAPMIIGSGKPGLALRPIARLTEARRPRAAVHVLPDGDVLFDCDMRSLT